MKFDLNYLIGIVLLVLVWSIVAILAFVAFEIWTEVIFRGIE